MPRNVTKCNKMKGPNLWQGSAQDAPLRHLHKKNSRGCKKTQIDGPEGAPNFSDEKTTKYFFKLSGPFVPVDLISGQNPVMEYKKLLQKVTKCSHEILRNAEAEQRNVTK